MSSSGPKRTRLERVAALELPPAHWKRLIEVLGRRQMVGRGLFALLLAVILCIVVRGWAPPFGFRRGEVPGWTIVARVSFEDPVATQRHRERILRQVRGVYEHDPQGLVKIREQFDQLLQAVQEGASWNDLELAGFIGTSSLAGNELTELQDNLEAFRLAVVGTPGTEALKKVLADVLAPYERNGLTLHPLQKPGEGHPEEIAVYPAGHPEKARPVKIAHIWLQTAEPLQTRLHELIPEAPESAQWLAHWMWDRLQRLGGTLRWDEPATKQAQEEALAQAEPVEVLWREGVLLAKLGQPLSDEHIRLLRLEHEAFLAHRTWDQLLVRATATTLLIFIALVVCGVYLFYRNKTLLRRFRHLGVLAGLLVATVVIMRIVAVDPWQAELVPLLLFAQVTAIAYSPELALLLSGVVTLVMGFGVGHPLSQMLVWFGASATAIAQTVRIRTRSKLIYIGLSSGIVAAALSLLASAVENQPLHESVFLEAGRTWFWAILAGFMMSGILPFVEKAFGVLTDISLLELSDVAHPLLQELVRRAPSTYNHSITVGSIAEAAADAIGARGLLVRVGAYFHDIGKMLNPGYFTENQSADADQHATLAPTVSSLVIIAHVKDGTDLARQHHLPEPIIDFIRQHHGTTRVEYFYARASGQKHADPNGNPVDESAYRYPGPKPQTKETCVLMLADAVEGASRSLIDPTPGRIQNLVHQITEGRLEDGQFDNSDLTLRQLRIIQDSLIKSLIAIYHGRIKYPEMKPA